MSRFDVVRALMMVNGSDVEMLLLPAEFWWGAEQESMPSFTTSFA
jgi:hypothetical protein